MGSCFRVECIEQVCDQVLLMHEVVHPLAHLCQRPAAAMDTATAMCHCTELVCYVRALYFNNPGRSILLAWVQGLVQHVHCHTNEEGRAIVNQVAQTLYRDTFTETVANRNQQYRVSMLCWRHRRLHAAAVSRVGLPRLFLLCQPISSPRLAQWLEEFKVRRASVSAILGRRVCNDGTTECSSGLCDKVPKENPKCQGCQSTSKACDWIHLLFNFACCRNAFLQD